MDHSPIPTVSPPVTVADLAHAGLLETGPGCVISPHAVFVPTDTLGTLRPIVLGERCAIAAGVVLHGGAQLAPGVRVEEHVIIGSPEYGYAVRNVYPGAGEPTVISADVVLRAGAIVYAGVSIGAVTVIGHHTLLRSHVTVGADSQLGHHLTVERACRIGDAVRMSPGTHLTAATELTPPRFLKGCKVGSGSTVLAGVTIGAHALVGAGSVVTHDIPPHARAYGVPARVRGTGGAR